MEEQAFPVADVLLSVKVIITITITSTLSITAPIINFVLSSVSS